MHLLLFSEPDSVFIFLNLKYNTVSNRSFCFHISLDLIKTFFNTYFLMVSHVFRCHTSCFLGGSVVKNSPANAGDARDVSLIPGSGRPPGVGNGNLLQYSCLENSMDRGAWQATIHRVTESDTTEHACKKCLCSVLFHLDKDLLESCSHVLSFSSLVLCSPWTAWSITY